MRSIGTTTLILVLVTLLAVAPSAAPAAATAAPTATTFSDVPDSHPFADEIAWMVGNDIANGYPNGTFLPANDVTRQATASFLYRYAHPAAPTPPACTSAPFADVPTDHPFCGAITWMSDQGLAGNFTELAAGRTHTCGLRPQGYFQCWGAIAAVGAPLP